MNERIGKRRRGLEMGMVGKVGIDQKRIVKEEEERIGRRREGRIGREGKRRRRGGRWEEERKKMRRGRE